MNLHAQKTNSIAIEAKRVIAMDYYKGCSWTYSDQYSTV